MRNKFLSLKNIITLSIFIMFIPSIIAQQQNESNYSSTINESNYYPPTQDFKNETANQANGLTQANKSIGFTISSAVSSAGELIGEKSQESVPLKDEKITAIETANKKINIEPILKEILESGYNPPAGVIKIADRKEQYKVPPGINDTILVKIYVSNKPTESLYSELKAAGAESLKYYPTEKLIKARVPIASITKIALLTEVKDVRGHS